MTIEKSVLPYISCFSPHRCFCDTDANQCRQWHIRSICWLHVSMFLYSKVIEVTIFKTFYCYALWWPQYCPDPKMLSVKVAGLVTTYQTQITISRFDPCFLIWGGGAKSLPRPESNLWGTTRNSVNPRRYWLFRVLPRHNGGCCDLPRAFGPLLR